MIKIDECNVTTAKSTDEIIANIKENVKHNYFEVTNSGFWRESVPIAIVGGGPSLKLTIKELKQYNKLTVFGPYRQIVACGSSHDYLIENKIYPNICVVCDPDEIMINYLQKPCSATIYLLASQCHPSIFKHLEKYTSCIWHAGGNNFDISEFGNRAVIGGGCTVGTRAICLALGMGFNNLHLFGFDTCLDENFKHHAYEFTDPEKETIGNITEIRLGGPEGKKFYVAGYHLGQLFDFQKMLRIYADRMQITVHGGGLLAHLMDLAKKECLNDKEN